jgi:hypothetical protein
MPGIKALNDALIEVEEELEWQTTGTLRRKEKPLFFKRKKVTGDPWSDLYTKLQKIVSQFSVQVCFACDGDIFYNLISNSRYIYVRGANGWEKTRENSVSFRERSYLLESLKYSILEAAKSESVSKLDLKALAIKENLDDLVKEEEMKTRKDLVSGLINELCCSKLGAEAYIGALKEEKIEG